MEIRAARVEDAPAITAIYEHYVIHSALTVDREPPSVQDWLTRLAVLADLGYPRLVAVEGGEVLGYALIAPWIAKPAFGLTAEDSIYLAPRATGVGRGRQLLDRLLCDASVAGIRQVLALIADPGTDGRSSLALHRGAGFAPAGRLRGVGWKHERWVDIDLLQRDLTS